MSPAETDGTMPEAIKWFATAGTTNKNTVTALEAIGRYGHEDKFGPMKKGHTKHSFVPTLKKDYSVTKQIAATDASNHLQWGEICQKDNRTRAMEAHQSTSTGFWV